MDAVVAFFVFFHFTKTKQNQMLSIREAKERGRKTFAHTLSNSRHNAGGQIQL